MLLSLVALSLAVVPPVPGKVIERFVMPACERCAGHRGVTIASTEGDLVIASVRGDIVFAGEVGGYLYVVQLIRPGVKVTYGWLGQIDPGIESASGKTPVAREMGQAIGVSGSRTYLGVRVNGRYVEPLGYLGLTGKRLTGQGGVVVGRRGLAR